ncbi:MFS transporter [Spirilliplanes yamanashiensis]|uniref:MFS transporter n=1 Tax=Spirilliplanes yamanashiensis TaxID=42233 RepID=A0A8J4DH72_9ACTN|nr:MFS transporter [Spirilliplanes yamanashiensis]MDP9814090.1 MFS family permease [Spirilliplanes yamanashiensis]GIJ00930.1 MFS transporter [Spirilliplanes yamanashiensis]
MTTTTTPAAPPAGLFSRPYVLATLGSSGLVFLAAFEALAVTTIMPVITAELDGRALYSLAFSATMAAGVVGMVAAGAWSDRRGPDRPLLVAVAVFALGLVAAGVAPSMGVFVGARFLQGLGGGGITVALYVVVGRAYPGVLHPRIFGLFAAAWVVPSMVGPFAAGVVADSVGWRWVFLGVLVLVAGATALILPVLGGGGGSAEPRAGDGRRIVAAVVVAGAAVALSVWGGRWPWLVPPVAVAVIVVAVRPLLPVGTFRARRGLPAVVLLCAVAGATFFSTEVYLPLLLHDVHGLPTWLSGVTLTAGAVSWAAASHVQGRLRETGHAAVIRTGAVLLAAGVAAELAVAAFTLHPALAAVGWLFAGGGMGLMYPRVSTLVLAVSAPGEEGFNAAARSISDAVGASVALALAGLLFTRLGTVSTWASFTGTLTFCTVVALSVIAVAGRVGDEKR